MLKLNKDWTFREVYPSVTAYTTTWNCLEGQYPVERSLKSFAWCDKIVVVDGGSTDGTRELLTKLQTELPNLEVIDIPIDEEMPGKDGYQKAMALAMCGTELAIQFDIDEICLGSPKNWKKTLKDLPNSVDILSLPVLEPIGNVTKIRMNKEHTPWKWRIFRVKPEISHGIPAQDRLEIDGKVYSRGGSDGCYPIHIVTNQMYPSAISSRAKKLTELKNADKPDEYSICISSMLSEQEPAILHLGHVDLQNKIQHYLSSWHKWWCMLYNKDANDPKNNMYFPGRLPAEVTYQDIISKEKEILDKTPTVTVDLQYVSGQG